MKPSPYQHQEIQEAVAKAQQDLSAVIILQNKDNSTTYLRYNISEEDMIEMLKNAYK